MEEFYAAALLVVAAAFAGLGIGWIQAHQVIATECQKLGSFYVADKTFECKAKP